MTFRPSLDGPAPPATRACLVAINILALFVAAVLAIPMESQAHAATHICDDTALRDCCVGTGYWMGRDPQATAAPAIDVSRSFETYWDSNGYLADSSRLRNGLTALFVLGVFALALVLLWWTSRRHPLPGWSQLLILIVLPGVAWYVIPEVHAHSVAHERADGFVNETLRAFCAEEPTTDPNAAVGTPCSPKLWAALFPETDGATARTPTQSCDGLVDVDGVLADSESPCTQACAAAMDAGGAVGGAARLRTRFKQIDNDLFTSCSQVADAWRAPQGPSPTDWRSCSDGLATRSLRRAVGAEPVLQFAWAGFALGAVLAVAALFIFRRR